MCDRDLITVKTNAKCPPHGPHGQWLCPSYVIRYMLYRDTSATLCSCPIFSSTRDFGFLLPFPVLKIFLLHVGKIRDWKRIVIILSHIQELLPLFALLNYH